MAIGLPNPLPDNPLRWDGWKLYNSTNYYERLCLAFDSNASNDQIEDHCRQLLVWWQKKLPLKNQPSNPVSQMLRAGLDEAPIYLVEARTVLLDPEVRKKHDLELRAGAITAALEEFKKLISFTLSDRQLRPEEEQRLMDAGKGLGLSVQDTTNAIESELARTGSQRVASAPAKNFFPPAATGGGGGAGADARPNDPFNEFRRLLRMSRLCLEGEEMTDDQRDAMCNLGESLGLTGGQAEDLIDEYLEEAAGMPSAPMAPVVARPVRAVAPTAPAAKPAVANRPASTVTTPLRRELPVITPLMRSQEKEKYPNFQNVLGMDMFLVTSGTFSMGSNSVDAQSNELPVTPVGISRYHMSRYPVTNGQYERFDPSHATKRAAWADENHPVVYVTAVDAERFCEWLSKVEGKRYRLPTEAEWEYAARGLEGRAYPWGRDLDAGHFANFADASSTFAWRDPRINDGFVHTAPVGSFPKGASTFGIEELSGNVFEWCLDSFEPYKGKEVMNPRAGRNPQKRVYRGGSWKSRAASLRASARHFNSQDYSSNDVGFRVVCECP